MLKGKSENEKRALRQTPLSVTQDVIGSLVGVYVFVIFTVFPLFATDMYFDILVDKYYFFWLSTAVCAALSLAVGLAGLFVEARERGGLKGKIRLHISAADGFLLLFLTVAAISTACSEWVYEAFWGTMGRYQGLFLLFWYGVAYFLISRFFRYRRWYLDAALAAGLYLTIWGIQDYLNLDPHGWLEPVAAEQKAIFSSSIGNINTYTAVVALYMALACVLFAGEGRQFAQGSKTGRDRQSDRDSLADTNQASISQGDQEAHENDAALIRWSAGQLRAISALRTLYYAACAFVFFIGMITGQSDNAVLGVAFILCFLPFYAWRERRGMVRYLLIVSLFFLSMLVVRSLTFTFESPYAGFWSGILLGLCEKSVIEKIFAAVLMLTLAVWAVFTFLSVSAKHPGCTLWQKYNSGMQKSLPFLLRWIWLALGVLAAAGLCFLFWDANHGGHPEWYDSYSNVFYFNNDWGTHRGHNWSLLLRHFRGFSLFGKLFGSGPETYGIYARVYDYTETVDLYGEFYDSPHNEFLQYLFTTGILGFIGYYGFIASGCLRAFGASGRKLGRKQRSAFLQPSTADASAAAFAAITYTVMSFINISVPIVVPLMLVILTVGVSSVRRLPAGSF